MTDRAAPVPVAPDHPGAVDGSRVHALTTTKADGDFRIDLDPALLADRRRRVAAHPWVWLRQVHGAEVVTVTADNRSAVVGASADALVTRLPDVVLAVHTADCAPVVLWDEAGSTVGLAHAGWQGLRSGVVEATVAAMRGLAAGPIAGRVGPCIHRECYEFGVHDLDDVASVYGDGVRAVTAAGQPALDLVAAVQAAGDRAGVHWRPAASACTACDPTRYFSYRARRDAARMATLVWRAR